MPIYQSIYDLIATYIFGAVEVGTYPDLVCIIGATVCSIAVIYLPLRAIIAGFEIICGLCRR